MYIKKFLAVVSLSVSLFACGGSDSPTPAPTEETASENIQTENDSNGSENSIIDGSDTFDNVTQFVGTLFFEQREQVVDDEVTFHRLEIAQELDILGFYNSNVETCRVSGFSSDDEEANPIDLVEFSPTVSAGETVILTGASGTFATFSRTLLFDGEAILYLPESELLSPMPQDLVLDIPGDEFPSFNNVAIPNVPALDITPAQDQPINANTEFRWNGGTEALGIVTIEADFTMDNGINLGVLCFPRDDGSFVFPADVKEQIGDAVADQALSYSRSAFNFLKSGNAELWIFNDRLE